MRTSFLHAADVYLGYRSPDQPEGFDRAAEHFRFVIDYALEQRASFVLFAGNLFSSPDVAPDTLQIALRGLTRLHDRNVAALAVLGQPELGNRQFSWWDLLSQESLLTVVDASITGGQLKLGSTDKRAGQVSYLDLGRTRVFGLHYYGSMTGLLLGEFADAVSLLDNREADFRIAMVNAALERFSSVPGPKLAYSDLLALQRQVHYVALGGCDGLYEAEGWAYNPGASGLYHVTVDTAVNPKHVARHVAYPDDGTPIRPHRQPDSLPRDVVERQILQSFLENESGPDQPLRGEVVGMVSQLLSHDIDAAEAVEHLLEMKRQ